MKKIHKTILAILLLIQGTFSAQAQTLNSPESSQQATVTQRIGLTDMRVTYHSPLAKNRMIWGEIVPYDSVWRAGANENTIISFSTDVKIENQTLAAGSYGLHMIPGKNEWTIIFSKNSSSWGSFFYDPSEDALRVKTSASTVDYQDWLSYQFTSIQPASANVTLRWDKISVSFKVEVDVNEIVFKSMKEELRGSDGFTWEAPLQAARFCLTKNIHLDQGRKWVELSVRTQENSNNLLTLAKYLNKEGKTGEAVTTKERAIILANEAELNAYGYSLLLTDKNISEAIEMFSLNVKRHPDSWNVYDSLGEAHDANKNKKDALKNYQIALSKAPVDQHPRIQQIIKTIESRQ
ncbi:MAG: DUF2911 domain-containing protein [Bacteroidia bacterium]|nr:DUF2911 domain-containing protein [Bacteroidia bacterium]